MYDYFNIFKKINVDGVDIVDISKLVIIKNNISSFLTEYDLKEGQTVNDLAYELYGDDRMFWLIYLVNEGMIFNPPLGSDQMNEFIKQKYLVTCCQLTTSIRAFPSATEPAKIVAFDKEWNEIEVVHTDPVRRQFILKTDLDFVRLLYKFDGTYRNLLGGAITSFGDPNSTAGTVGFDISLWADAAHHYLYNDIEYTNKPSVDELLITTISWEEYERELNSERSTIMIIRPEYKERVIDIVRKFIRSRAD
jgi:hypothetical protein